MTDTAPASDHCLNCGQAFGAPRPKYCPACGQETNVRPPTLAEFAQQFGGSVMAAEGALWRTLALLFLKPGQLTREYLAGRRRRYVLPLRLYLTMSLVALLVLRLGSALQFQVDDTTIVRVPPNELQLELSFGPQGPGAGLHDGVFFCRELPGWLCKRLQRRIDLDPKHVGQELEQASQRFLNHWGSAMFVLVPIFAVWLKLAYLRRRMRYTEHLVFALHLHSFWFAIVALMQVVPGGAFIGMIAVPAYALLATQRVYRGRWWATLARNAFVAVAYALTLTAALGTVAFWTLIF